MMKLKTIFATMLISFGLVTTMTSCSDDEDEPATPAAREIAGSYNSDMTCSVMGQESIFEDQNVKVTAIDDNNVSITIASFGNPPMQLPEITITGVAVTGENGVYKIAETQFNGTAAGDKVYSGTIQGSFSDGKISISFNLQYGAMPMPMICSFTAPKN